ncbi:hypothetical protein ACF3NG_08330 [Aerococcaceae bacterium WGS1372]
MAVYFEQKNWEPFLYKRLNQLIEEFKSNDVVDMKDRSYVVFDFDNTSVIGDIEDNLMVYMMDHLLYRLSPADFRRILISEDFDMNTVLNERYPQATPLNLANDIVYYYETLYDLYSKDQKDREALLTDENYLAFKSKLRFYYTHVNSQFNRQPARPWLTYWFQGYTAAELQALTIDMLKEMTQKQTERMTYTTPASHAGEAGIVESQFISGLKAPEELKDLYKAFQEKNIIPYIVSASPVDVVVQASQYFFQVDRQYVRGMNYQFDEHNKIVARMNEDSPITKKDGKTETILTTIANIHNGQQPIALFGDSMGDYHMMTELKEVKVNVLFNCLNQDKTVSLKAIASNQYNDDQATYLIQGRDENTLSLIPSTHSRLLNQTDLKY